MFDQTWGICTFSWLKTPIQIVYHFISYIHMFVVNLFLNLVCIRLKMMLCTVYFCAMFDKYMSPCRFHHLWVSLLSDSVYDLYLCVNVLRCVCLQQDRDRYQGYRRHLAYALLYLRIMSSCKMPKVLPQSLCICVYHHL